MEITVVYLKLITWVCVLSFRFWHPWQVNLMHVIDEAVGTFSGASPVCV